MSAPFAKKICSWFPTVFFFGSKECWFRWDLDLSTRFSVINLDNINSKKIIVKYFMSLCDVRKNMGSRRVFCILQFFGS